MNGQITPEPPNEEGFADLTGRIDEGPVTMLNLLAFKPDRGRERYAEYGAAVLPLLELEIYEREEGQNRVSGAPAPSPSSA